MATVVTLLQMAAQDSGAADLDRGHDTALRDRQRNAVLLTIGFAVAAKHIRHLKLRAIHFPELASLCLSGCFSFSILDNHRLWWLSIAGQ